MPTQEGQLVLLLSPDGSPSSLLGIVKWKLEKKSRQYPGETMWYVRHYFDSGLSNVKVPAKYILPIIHLSHQEQLFDPPIPGAFDKINPNQAFAKYYQRIRPRLVEIREHLNVESLARILELEGRETEAEDLKTLAC